MKPVAVFGRFSGGDRFKPIIKRADMNFLSANFDIGKPSVISLGDSKNAMLMVICHRFVFGIFLPVNFAQIIYSVIKTVVVYVVNNVWQLPVNVKPCDAVGGKGSIVNRQDYIPSGLASSFFPSVPKIPSVVIRFNKLLRLPCKNPSIGVVIENGF
jgi:hypothetical protein